MMKGIYSYIDCKTGLVVYIGKDSHKRVSLKSLEEEVKRRGLEWKILDEDKARETLKLDKRSVLNWLKH